MLLEEDWLRMEKALRHSVEWSRALAWNANGERDAQSAAQYEADAKAAEAVLAKMAGLPSWFEVWAAFDVVADVVEDRNLELDACLECDQDVDVQGVCLNAECRLRDALLVHWGRDV